MNMKLRKSNSFLVGMLPPKRSYTKVLTAAKPTKTSEEAKKKKKENRVKK